MHNVAQRMDDACVACQTWRTAAASLPRTRLGRHERALLLRAGPPDAPVVILPLDSAERRSLVTLRRKGLVGVKGGRQRVADPEAVAISGRKWLRPRLLYRT